MKLTTMNLLTGTNILKDAQKLQSVMECKFVLLTQETEHILIFGPLHTYNFHAQLIEKFCSDRSINFNWKKQPDLLIIADDSLKIKGGGWFSIDFLKKTVTAKSISTAYGRFDEQTFTKFINKNLVFMDFKISIGK